MKLGLIALATALLLNGCAADNAGGTAPPPGDNNNNNPPAASGEDPQRNEGPVEVFYSSLEKCAQPGGCPIDREVFAGSEVDVVIRNLQPNIVYAARTNDASIAEARTTPHCDVNADRTCAERITINTHKAGDVSLEIYDEISTAIQRRVTIRVRDPISVVSNVTDASGSTLTPSSDGVYELRVGAALNITSSAKSASGNELLFMRGAFGIKYTDTSILGPRDVTFGGSSTEYATAWRSGTAAVTIIAHENLTNEVHVRVLP